MVSRNPEVVKRQTALMRASRYGGTAPDQLRAELVEAQIVDYITKKLAKAPPLSAEQRARLTALLTGGGA